MRNINVMAKYLNMGEIKMMYGDSKDTLRLLSGIVSVSQKYPHHPAA